MKSLKELQAIRDKAKVGVRDRTDTEGYRIVVGMATCGIAAGARPVMSALMDEVQKEGIANATIAQTGCIGMCRLEPMVEVYSPDGAKTTYIKMTEDKARKMIHQHIMNGNPVTEYVIGYEE